MITYTAELNLRDFGFWSGAKDNVKHLTLEELDVIDAYVSEFEWTMTETEVNDMFWFDFDTICEEVLLLDPETVYNRGE